MNFLQLLLTQVSHLQDYLCIKESLLPLLTFITLDLCGLPSLWGESIFRRTIHHVSGGGYTRWRLMGSPPFLIGMKGGINTSRNIDNSEVRDTIDLYYVVIACSTHSKVYGPSYLILKIQAPAGILDTSLIQFQTSQSHFSSLIQPLLI